MKHEVNKGVLEKKNKKINDKNKGNIKAFVFSQKLDSWTISDQSKMASAQLTLPTNGTGRQDKRGSCSLMVFNFA